eukprot:SAG22_NODE_920_length_6497_cov_7.779775_1_plen_2103_part_10
MCPLVRTVFRSSTIAAEMPWDLSRKSTTRMYEDSSAAGNQDNCHESCFQVECSHGTCQPRETFAGTCVCEDGWVGPRCSGTEMCPGVCDVHDTITPRCSATMIFACCCDPEPPPPPPPYSGGWVVNGTGSCPPATLPRRFEMVNAACCAGNGCPHGMIPITCSLDCAATFVPFYVECGPVIDALFDGTDGEHDGQVKAMSGFFTRCTTIPASEVVDAIVALNQSCTIQTTGIEARTADVVAAAGSGRRLQLGYAGMDACSFTTIDARLATVNTACCDTANTADACVGLSVAPACTVECAAFDFDSACQGVLTMMFPALLDEFHQLVETCDAIPVPPMLQRIVDAVGSCQCDDLQSLSVTESLLCSPDSGPPVTSHLSLPHLRVPQSDEDADWLADPIAEPSYPIVSFEERLNEVNAACCGGSHSCGDGPPKICDLECAIQFVPFYNACNATANALFDAEDGVHDGIAQHFVDFKHRCLQVDDVEVSGRMNAMIDDGCTMDTAGIDSSAGEGIGRRYLQIGTAFDAIVDPQTCSLSQFRARVDAVDTACCDDGAKWRDNQIARTCSALWLDMQRSCSKFIQVAFSTSQATLDAYSALTTACRHIPHLAKAAMLKSIHDAEYGTRAGGGGHDHDDETGFEWVGAFLAGFADTDSDSRTPCARCPAGESSSAVSNTVCDGNPCQAGTMSGACSASYDECPRGYYTPNACGKTREGFTAASRAEAQAMGPPDQHCQSRDCEHNSSGTRTRAADGGAIETTGRPAYQVVKFREPSFKVALKTDSWPVLDVSSHNTFDHLFGVTNESIAFDAQANIDLAMDQFWRTQLVVLHGVNLTSQAAAACQQHGTVCEPKTMRFQDVVALYQHEVSQTRRRSRAQFSLESPVSWNTSLDTNQTVSQLTPLLLNGGAITNGSYNMTRPTGRWYAAFEFEDPVFDLREYQPLMSNPNSDEIFPDLTVFHNTTWVFCGHNLQQDPIFGTSTQSNIQQPSHAGSWYVQLSGSTTWMFRPRADTVDDSDWLHVTLHAGDAILINTQAWAYSTAVRSTTNATDQVSIGIRKDVVADRVKTIYARSIASDDASQEFAPLEVQELGNPHGGESAKCLHGAEHLSRIEDKCPEFSPCLRDHDCAKRLFAMMNQMDLSDVWRRVNTSTSSRSVRGYAVTTPSIHAEEWIYSTFSSCMRATVRTYQMQPPTVHAPQRNENIPNAHLGQLWRAQTFLDRYGKDSFHLSYENDHNIESSVHSRDKSAAQLPGPDSVVNLDATLNLKATYRELWDAAEHKDVVTFGGAAKQARTDSIDDAMDAVHMNASSIKLTFGAGAGCEDLRQLIYTTTAMWFVPVTANVYTSGPFSRAYDNHSDHYDVLIMQLQGQKKWTLCVPNSAADTISALSEICPSCEHSGALLSDLYQWQLRQQFNHSGRFFWEPKFLNGSHLHHCQSMVLSPGDILYVPRGQFHSAVEVVGGITSHITLAIRDDAMTSFEFIDTLLAYQSCYVPCVPALNGSNSSTELFDTCAAGEHDCRSGDPIMQEAMLCVSDGPGVHHCECRGDLVLDTDENGLMTCEAVAADGNSTLCKRDAMLEKPEGQQSWQSWHQILLNASVVARNSIAGVPWRHVVPVWNTGNESHYQSDLQLQLIDLVEAKAVELLLQTAHVTEPARVRNWLRLKALLEPIREDTWTARVIVREHRKLIEAQALDNLGTTEETVHRRVQGTGRMCACDHCLSAECDASCDPDESCEADDSCGCDGSRDFRLCCWWGYDSSCECDDSAACDHGAGCDASCGPDHGRYTAACAGHCNHDGGGAECLPCENGCSSTGECIIDSDKCVIGGQCFVGGEYDIGGCYMCNPDVSQTEWTDVSSSRDLCIVAESTETDAVVCRMVDAHITRSTSNGQCQCRAGHFGDGNTCLPCTTGVTFASEAGQATCTTCVNCVSEKGRVQLSECTSTANTVCGSCINGYDAHGTCISSRYLQDTNDECVPCPAGFRPTADRSTCEICSFGTFSKFGVSCEVCSPPNEAAYATVFFSGSGSQSAAVDCLSRSTCDAGTYCPHDACTEHSQCMPCAPGSVGLGSTCNTCNAPGQVANAAQSACTRCVAGTQPSPDRSECMLCPSDT